MKVDNQIEDKKMRILILLFLPTGWSTAWFSWQWVKTNLKVKVKRENENWKRKYIKDIEKDIFKRESEKRQWKQKVCKW